MVAVAACGSSSSSSSSSSSTAAAATIVDDRQQQRGVTAASPRGAPGADPAVAKLVPAAIKSKGTLTVAADASYAPNEFFASDGHTVIGMDADLSAALAAAMGLKAKVVNETFDGIIPGLAAGKYDIGASSFTDTKAREKMVDFVDYFSAGESFFTKASGGASITGLSDICGKTVAVEKGTVEETDAQTQSKKCKSSGKGAVTVLSFPDQNGANLALNSGRPSSASPTRRSPPMRSRSQTAQFKLVGAAFATAPYGLAIPKKSGLAPAVLAALKALMQNGSYTKILTKWGVQSGAISGAAVKINGATS